MKQILQNLVKLQSLEFGEIKDTAARGAIAELRGKIPAPLLAHYDRLVARGKKGIAEVRNQVCSGCHMRLPSAVIIDLMHARDVQLCDCGRYLYLPDLPGEGTPPPVPASGAMKKTRGTRVAAGANSSRSRTG